MAGNPAEGGKSPYTYQRRMVPMIAGVMIAIYIAAFVVLCISCASTSWVAVDYGAAHEGHDANGPTRDLIPDKTLGLWKYCDGGEIPCVSFKDVVDANNTGSFWIRESDYKKIDAVRGLQIWCILLTLTPIPLVVMALTTNMNFGIYAHGPVLFWLVFWIPLTVVFKQAAHSILVNVSSELQGYSHNTKVSEYIQDKTDGSPEAMSEYYNSIDVSQFFSSGSFLNYAAVALMLLSLLVFWASYFMCFQVDVYDENGEKVDVEELMRKRQDGKPNANREHV